MQFDQLKRREFIALLGGAAAGWPLTARAQLGAKIPRVGIVSPGRSDGSDASRATLDSLLTGQFVENESFKRFVSDMGFDMTSGAPYHGSGCTTEGERQEPDHDLWPEDRRDLCVEFKTAAGDALAISIPRTEAAVIRHFQERMPYGLFVPNVNAI